jgi:hypothetical protein
MTTTVDARELETKAKDMHRFVVARLQLDRDITD